MNWPITTLGDVGRFQAGYGFPKKYQGKLSGDYPFAKVGDISSAVRQGNKYISSAANYIDSSELPLIRAKTLPTGSIVFAKIGEAIRQNFRAVTATEMVVDNNSMGLIPDMDKIDLDYLYHFMCKLDLYAYTGVTTVPAIRKSTLEEIAIPIPPLPEQKRIAAILDKADALRRKRQQAIDLADQFLRSVFLDMFGDPVTNPKGIRKSVLGDLIKVASGNGLTSAQMDPDGDYPVYGGNGITGKHSEFMFTEPQVSIGRVGVYCGAVYITEPQSWLTDNSLYVKEYKEELDIDYLAEALKIARLNQYAGQAAQPLISGNRIYPVAILVPSLIMQKKFANTKRKLVRHIGRCQISSAELRIMFCSISQQAFAGTL